MNRPLPLLALILSLLLAVRLPLVAKPLLEAHSRFLSYRCRHGLVVCADKQAGQAGLEALEDGGNAVDAAVTTAFALAVTLPRAGNLGGGGFMLIRSPRGKVYALDFREDAPAAASRDMYLDSHGKVDNRRATLGALSVGVPGTVAGLHAALKRFGTFTFRQAAEPAYHMASYGIRVDWWLHDGLTRAAHRLRQFPSTAQVYLPGGKVPPLGSLLKQPDLALSLHELMDNGAAAFYDGPIGRRVIATIQANGGIMTMADLRSYRAVWRKPIRGSFGPYTIYSMPPPSSGGVLLVEMLNVLDGRHFDPRFHNSARDIHYLAEVMRSAYADRSRWLGDPDFFHNPVHWLTSRAYARKIRAEIPLDHSRRSKDVFPGKPPTKYESRDTTHLCVVDDKGWAVSMTYTINFSYGSALVADGTGILLNDEMDDFSAAPGSPNAYGLLGGKANAIAPRKRPLSSMTPTIVQRDGRLVAALGSPGGSRIITAVLQVLLNVLAYHFNAQTSVSLPRIHHQWYPDHISYEQGISADTLQKLRAMGHHLKLVDAIGHVMLILVHKDGTLEAGLDPRRPAYAEGF